MGLTLPVAAPAPAGMIDAAGNKIGKQALAGEAEEEGHRRVEDLTETHGRGRRPRPRPPLATSARRESDAHRRSNGTEGFAYIPGLSAPATLDTATLPPGEAAVLEAAVKKADFSASAAQAAAPAPGRGRLSDRHGRVEDGGSSRSITVSDPITDEALRTLVDRVLAAAHPA